MAWKLSFRQNYRTTFSPAVPTSATGISHVVADVEAPGGEKWEHLKSERKQWQATSKNLPRMQSTKVIPVPWLNSGLCPDRPKGFISIIIIIIIIIIRKYLAADSKSEVTSRRTNSTSYLHPSHTLSLFFHSLTVFSTPSAKLVIYSNSTKRNRPYTRVETYYG